MAISFSAKSEVLGTAPGEIDLFGLKTFPII
jgi:hypothetical protein